MVMGSSPLPLYDLMPRNALMTPARLGFCPARCSPRIMRSQPSHDKSWLKLGNSLLVKCAYLVRAAAISSVPALGNENGRARDKKYAPWRLDHSGEWTMLGS